MVWLSAAAVVVAIGALLLMLSLLAVRGFGHFWPQPLILLQMHSPDAPGELGVLLDRETGVLATGEPQERVLLYRGGSTPQEATRWIAEADIGARSYPTAALAVELRDEGPRFGFAEVLSRGGEQVDLATMDAGGQLTLLQELLEAPVPEGTLTLLSGSGLRYRLPLAQVLRVEAPNSMGTVQKLQHAAAAIWRFLSESPRRVNSAGGVFPAIVGTVVLVMLMSVAVTPLGILAAVFLQEYSRRGVLPRLVRIAVNNLAGVPSIVYGVFGLGFFVYQLGGSLDELLFRESLPAPTLGTPGLLWASLTMALLTLPVVIVATEEGLARVPQSLREGSLALGATRAETLWRVVLPAASPALLTGLILAIARATGEVAPLILVGVAKYAPVLPVSGDFPFLHLDRQFMHLGFHIFDLGFQNPQLQHSTGRVFATALLLVLIVLLLNLSAVILRSRLREAFKAQDLL